MIDLDQKRFGDLYLVPSRNGLTRPSAVRGLGFKMINMGELYKYPRINNPEMERVKLNEREIQNYNIIKGDLLFARQSLVLEGAGKCSIVLEYEEPTTFESHLIRVRLNKKVSDALFYFYYFNSSAGFGSIQTLVNQVSAAGIRGSDLEKLKILYLPIQTQRKIAAILSSYDDLIENNNKQISLLEKMAEEIYKEWFVRMRFPGFKKAKFVKGIPDCWNKVLIEKLCDEIRKGIKRKKINSDARYIGLEHIPQKTFALKSFANIDTVDSDKLVFNDRDILFAKIRPYLHKVVLAHFSGVCSSDTIVIRAKRKIYEAFVLFTVFSDTFIELATISSKGTKMPRADWDFLKKLEVILPDEDLLEEFQLMFDKMFEQVTNLLKQNELLGYSKQLLLPRLLSGKLNVENLNIKFPPSMENENA